MPYHNFNKNIHLQTEILYKNQMPGVDNIWYHRTVFNQIIENRGLL
jgi:hypothetical protein